MPVLSDRYELGRRVGAGGMGDVYEAYDQRLARRVAIKRLRAGLATEHAHERFAREVHHSAALTHPNLVTVFDVGDDGEHPYFVMELVDGRTLATALAADGQMPVDEAVRIADAVLSGLAAAHARGLVHRDVKPANVLLGADGSVKLTDFGIAKAVHDAATQLTAAGQLLGTPAYLSPEQTQGEDAGPHTDVYAVGILLYEMLAGAPPFRGDTPLATALAHRDAPVPPLGARREGLPPALVGVVERALEKQPERRFADAAAMRAALDRAVHPGGTETPSATVPVVPVTGTLPLAPPRPPAPPARATPARHAPRPRRLVPALVAGVLAAVLVGGAVLALQGGGDPDASEAAGAAAARRTAVAPDPTLPPSTTTTVPTPRTLGELLAVLAGNPDAYGPRGSELLDALTAVASGRADVEDVQQLLDDIAGWSAAGELDAEIAAIARQQLATLLALAASADDGGGRGRGNGNGNGRGGDDGGDD